MDFLDYAMPAEPTEGESFGRKYESEAWPPVLGKETAAAMIFRFGWLSPEQLAVAHGVDRSTIYRWIERAAGDQEEQEKVRRLLHLDHA